MTKKRAYCIACGQEQPYSTSITAEPCTHKGLSFYAPIVHAHCTVCGEEVYVPEINDANAESRTESYKHALDGEISDPFSQLNTGMRDDGYLNNGNGSLNTGANDLRLNGVEVMTGDTFQTICQEQMNICSDVLFNKAKEYAQDNDRLHNFRSAAGMTGDSMRAALAGMMLKHTISVYDMCRSAKQYPLALWTEKITDHINYLLLLKAVVVEELMSHEEPPEGEPYKENQDGTEQET